VQNVTDRIRNPFGISPGCSRYVQSYGDVNASFHVIGDHPGIHGGFDKQIPFTAKDCRPLLDALDAAELLESTTEGDLHLQKTFFSYLHRCEPTERPPSAAAYTDQSRLFDAELRAIAPHVLLPVGKRATRYVLTNYSARAKKLESGMTTLHAREVPGSGFLILPIESPSKWGTTEKSQLVTAIQKIRSKDFRREADLGRFIAGNEPYLVR
jgi:uracil-DNA glycosylase